MCEPSRTSCEHRNAWHVCHRPGSARCSCIKSYGSDLCAWTPVLGKVTHIQIHFGQKVLNTSVYVDHRALIGTYGACMKDFPNHYSLDNFLRRCHARNWPAHSCPSESKTQWQGFHSKNTKEKTMTICKWVQKWGVAMQNLHLFLHSSPWLCQVGHIPQSTTRFQQHSYESIIFLWLFRYLLVMVRVRCLTLRATMVCNAHMCSNNIFYHFNS